VLRTLVDLPIDLKLFAVDRVVDRVELELAPWEKAQTEHVH
jgi:hypothetical protein